MEVLRQVTIREGGGALPLPKPFRTPVASRHNSENKIRVLHLAGEMAAGGVANTLQSCYCSWMINVLAKFSIKRSFILSKDLACLLWFDWKCLQTRTGSSKKTLNTQLCPWTPSPPSDLQFRAQYRDAASALIWMMVYIMAPPHSR